MSANGLTVIAKRGNQWIKKHATFFKLVDFGGTKIQTKDVYTARFKERCSNPGYVTPYFGVGCKTSQPQKNIFLCNKMPDL